MKKETFFICSPTSSQAQCIAGFLRTHYPQTILVGVLFPGESRPILGNSPYDSFVSFDAADRELPLIPTGAVSTKALLEQGDIRVGSITLFREALQVFNKPWILQQATEAGLPIPQTWFFADEITRYPVFYKQRYEKGGGVRGIARTPSAIPLDGQEELIFQEYIESQGTYGVGFLAEKGELLAHHTHFEKESYPKSGGSAVFIEKFENPRLLEYTSRLLRFINYSGWGLAEFKYCPRRDDFVFMEINAKFWASCEFAFRNQPMFLKLLFDIEAQREEIQEMIFLDRALERGIPFLVSNFRSFFGNKAIRLYPGWGYRFAARSLPTPLRNHLKALFKRGKTPTEWGNLNEKP